MGEDEQEQKPQTDYIQLEDASQAEAPAKKRKAWPYVAGAVACVALVVLSLGFMYPSKGSTWSLDWVPQLLQGKTPQKTTKVVEEEVPPEQSEEAPKDEQPETSEDVASAEQAPSSATPAESSSSIAVDSNAQVDSSQQAESGQASDASNQAADDEGGQVVEYTTETAGGGQSAAQPSQPAGITVSVSISSNVPESPASGGGTVTLAQGATALDALRAVASVSAEDTQYGPYVTNVNGVAAAANTGWTYYVNGEMPMQSAAYTELNNGDSVSWVFVTAS